MVSEPPRQTPVRAEVDVLVAGGGLGGIAAALSAARAGANVTLVERNAFLGGVATAGMCCSMFNCFYTADHRLGVKGIALEVADGLAEAMGYGTKWHSHKGHIIYDVELAKGLLESLVESAGVRVLYQTVVCGAVTGGGSILGVLIESKSGREAILSRVVVDATGDADVAALAGAPLHTNPRGAKHSYCFRLGGVDVDRFVDYFASHPDQYPDHMDVDWTVGEALAQYRDTGTFLFPHGGAMQMDIIKQARQRGEYPESVGIYDTLDACQMHAVRDTGIVHIVTGHAYFHDLDIGNISRAMIDGRQMARQVTAFFGSHVLGFESARVVGTATNLGIRASRWSDGAFVFTRSMKEHATRFADAVGRGVVQVDLRKHAGEGAWGVQTFTSETFDVPYRCLVPRDVDGLLMGAGRSVSAEDPYLLRVMVHTMVIGQAAGAASAVAVLTDAPPREVDIGAVQSELRRQGVELGELQ
jgi:hypothetical protein